MELDPRLRSSNGNGNGDTAPSSSNNHPTVSSTDSPSAAAHLFPHSRHDGADSSDGSPLAHQQQHHDGDDGSDPKRPRACEACRGLKVRCEPDPNDDGPCKRCKKAGRNCVVTVPTRKRQKKTDSRVAELEKKIDALTASLQARAAPAGGSNLITSPVVGQRNSVDEPAAALSMVWRNAGPSWPPPPGMEHLEQQQRVKAPPAAQETPPSTAGQKRKFSEGRHREDQQQQQQQQQQPPRQSPFEIPSLDTPSIFSRINQGDLVERGLITMEKAADLFARYNDHMVLHLPAVVFPPATTVSELRKEKPTLFHAIMAASTSESPALQKVLQKELMTIFAEKIIITGEKSVELVQALTVAVIWYWPPEHFEELKFYQLVHIAAVMAIDVGLGQRTPVRRQKFIPDGWRVSPFRRTTPPDPTSIENRRTWLTCYFLAANTSMALHRPNLVRWNPFMSECVSILETSLDAAPTDKYFCHLVWTHRLAEEVGIQFSLDDPTAVVNIADSRTQYALKGLERDLDKYSASVPSDLMQPTLRIGFHNLNLYMHEMALHSRASPDQRPHFAPDNLRDGFIPLEPLSAAHISALSACLSAINGMLTTFLEMDVFSVRCLPVFNFVRVAYAIVILIKLYFSASAPGSELGRVINKDDMQVEYLLDALLDKFRATAADDRSRPAAKFLVVLVMLRSWFYKQSKVDKGEQQPPTPAPHAQQHPQPGVDHSQTVNTPLQLLSEVATGGSSAGAANNATPSSAPVDTPASRASFASWTGIRQPPQPFFHDTAHTPATTNTNDTPPSLQPPPLDMSSAELAAAMAPGIPTMLPNGQGGFTPDLDYGLNGSFDLEGLGLGFDSQDAYENGVRIVMNEPWFSDMFQHMPGTGNVFNF